MGLLLKAQRFASRNYAEKDVFSMTNSQITAALACQSRETHERGVCIPFDGKRTGSDVTPLEQFINHKGRPKAEDPKVNISIRIPLSKAIKLRKTGRGWQTRTSNYIVDGIDRGILAP